MNKMQMMAVITHCGYDHSVPRELAIAIETEERASGRRRKGEVVNQ